MCALADSFSFEKQTKNFMRIDKMCKRGWIVNAVSKPWAVGPDRIIGKERSPSSVCSTELVPAQCLGVRDWNHCWFVGRQERTQKQQTVGGAVGAKSALMG